MIRGKTLQSILILLVFVSSLEAQSDSARNLIFVLDASGSMWQKVEGEFKIAIARKVLKDMVGELPENSNVGLIAYGHRRDGDCKDIETIIPLGALNKAVMAGKIDGIDAKGKTPITDSIRMALELARSKDGDTAIVLLSDGLETCGGDPCKTVETARNEGAKFVIHVIGFDLGKEDVSQLECAAQAGGGLYLSAANSNELAAALKKTAVESEVPSGRLSVKVVANGKLDDAGVRVFKSGTRDEVAFGRTYFSPQTNPRVLPVPEGIYDVEVRAVRLKGNVNRLLKGVEVKDKMIEKMVDFSPGELSIKVTRNGRLSDAVVNVYNAGSTETVTTGRTYTAPTSNPTKVQITSGEYDVVISAIEIADKPKHRFTGVVVESAGKAERSHDFSSGTMKIGAMNGGQLVDATVFVTKAETSTTVAQGRTYVSTDSNPRVFELSPGKYRVKVSPVKLEGRPVREIEIVIEAAKTVEQTVDFSK